MAGATNNFQIPLISGGSDDPEPDEVADAKDINDGFKEVDNYLGVLISTSTTNPASPKRQQLIVDTDTGILKYWSGTQYVQLINTAAVVPAGAVFATACSVLPAGYLACGGASLLRTDYTNLFNAIGTQFGAVDATHFNLPNLRGRVPVAVDTAQAEFNVLGKTGGAKTHTLTTAEMPSHSHTAPTSANVSGTFEVAPVTPQGYDYIGGAPTGATGGGGAHNNLQPYIAMIYIIKT